MGKVTDIAAARRKATVAERQRKSRFRREMRALGYRFVDQYYPREAVAVLAALGALPYAAIENDDVLTKEICELLGRVVELVAKHPEVAEALRYRESQ